MTRLLKVERYSSAAKSAMSTSLGLSLFILSAATLVVHASPVDRDEPLSERIMFALEGPRSMRIMQGPGHRRHSVVSPSGAEVVHAFEGQDVVLECEAASRSGPSIHWLHRGKRISQVGDGLIEEYESEFSEDLSISTGSTRSKLYLDCVSARDAGEYICVADTPTSRNISVRTLVVDEAPQEIRERRLTANSRSAKRAWKGKSSSCERKSNENDAARIYLWSTRRLVVEDSDIRLLCRASGTPQPKIVWLDRNEKPISADDQYQILSNGDLVIRKTTFKQNMGVYQCLADNGYGVDTVTTFVYPAGKETGGPASRLNPLDMKH